MKTIKAIAAEMNVIAVNKIIPLLGRFENNQEVYYYSQFLVDGGYTLRPSSIEEADVMCPVEYSESTVFEFNPGRRNHIDVDTMCDLIGCERDQLQPYLWANAKAILDEIAEL